jgi:hypothetical protein
MTAADRAIAELEAAGRTDLAELVSAGHITAKAALLAAGLRQLRSPSVRKPKPAAEPDDGLSCLEHADERTWIKMAPDAAIALDAKQGDAITVRLELVRSGEGPPECVEVIGVAGDKGRIWLTDYVDPHTVEVVTVGRRRRV